MFGLDIKKVKEKEQQLIHYNKWIPAPIVLYIDVVERRKYLEGVGLYDDFVKKDIAYRYDMKLSPNEDLFEIKAVKKWVEDNPQFSDLLLD